MKHPYSTFISLMLLLAMTYPVAPGTAQDKRDATPPVGVLDGMTFAVEGGQKGKQAMEKDIIKFRKGKLHSEGCDVYGFDKGKYTATKSGDMITFQAETKSKKEGAITW